ncbi:MAG: sigma-70 family RNA polymerase sigma factor [Proteobacteria bacterium]|nr:sigma-70 family RNA polymerase sigma factor [Pseudomonadota bacterium]
MGRDNRYEGLDEYAVKIIRHKARQLVGRAGLVAADRDDLEQDMVMDLLRRLPRFDPSKAKRETFISRIVEHRVATIIETQKAGLRDYRCNAGSLDERRADEGGGTGDMPPVLDQDSYRRETLGTARQDEDLRDLRRDIAMVVEDLPSDLRELCRRLLTSTVSEVSRETGVPRGTIYESVQKLRSRFEKGGLAAYLDGADTSRRAPVGNR